MTKPKDEVIKQFNEQVNMTAEELEKWMDGDESGSAGTGVGQDSGRKIVQILKRNPDMDPDKYEDDDIEHMRRVVAYNARHMAQEDHLKDTKTAEELEHTKSTISLRNWGHDPMKTEGAPKKSNGNVEGATEKDDTEEPAETGLKRKRGEQTGAAVEDDAEEADDTDEDADAEGEEDADGVADDDEAIYETENDVVEQREEEKSTEKNGSVAKAAAEEPVAGDKEDGSEEEVPSKTEKQRSRKKAKTNDDAE